MINIYIDSQIKGARRSGWYGYVLEFAQPGRPIRTLDDMQKAEDTSNRIFLRAAIEALRRITRPMEIHIYMPCPHVVYMAKEGMLPFWKLSGWRNSNNQEVKNRDLWEQVLELIEEYNPEWHEGKHKHSEKLMTEFRKKEQEEMRECQ